MRICFLAPANSAHTQKWCRFFVEKGYDIHVVSFTEGYIDGVTVHVLGDNSLAEGSDLQKLKYLTFTRKVKKLVDKIQPDILNVHYATSYGAVAALAGIKNYVLSVWGSDIYDFPSKSILHRWLLQFSLSRATHIFSTSKAMAAETGKYTKKRIEITPFGVDMQLFSPNKNVSNKELFIVGTVKTLSPKYGIDFLLKAAALITSEHPEIPLRIRISGSGSNEQEYHALADTLGLGNITTWPGFISQEQAAKEWAGMDVAVVPSTLESESFGVSAVEAQACGCPVIISDIPGLMESTKPGETSLVVPRKNERALADALVSLFYDAPLRKKMGQAGVAYVAEHYEYRSCFEKIEELFRNLVVTG